MTCLSILGLLLVLAGCQKTSEKTATLEPSAAETSTSQPFPEPESQPMTLASGPRSESHIGWLTVRSLHDDSRGGWSTGDFDREKNRIIIKTQNVNEFSIRLSALPIDRSKRIRLRIDGRNREISRDLTGTLIYHQSPGGSWELVKE